MSKFIAILLGSVMISGSVVFAESTQFTPLNFNDSPAISTKSAPVSSSTVSGIQEKGTDILDASQVVGGTKMQNSILQLDNAQVEIRNQLLNYRANYAEIDGKYQVTKAERKVAKKKIKSAERKIKNIDKVKKKIQTNFQRKNNV